MRLVDVSRLYRREGSWAMYLDDAAAKLREFEAEARWMYLDTRGFVTVGVGRLLADVDDALALPFEVDGAKASYHAIAGDYAQVKTMPAGKPLGYYESATQCRLDGRDIDAMLLAQVHEIDASLMHRLERYALAPVAARLALLDMAYNLGVRGLLQGYPRLLAAVKSGDWKTAAAECHRDGPSEARNEWTRAMFVKAE